MDKDEFIYPKRSYRGHFTLKNLIFNSNLQEFAKQIDIITNCQTRGKISPHEAYCQIESLWQELEASTNQLQILD